MGNRSEVLGKDEPSVVNLVYGQRRDEDKKG